MRIDYKALGTASDAVHSCMACRVWSLMTSV